MIGRVGLVILGVLGLAPSANSIPMRVDFSGTVTSVDTSVNGESLLAELGPTVAVGSLVSGFFVFDGESLGSNLEFPPGAFSMTIGDIIGTVDVASFNVVPETNAFVEGPVVQVSARADLPGDFPADVGLAFSYWGLPPLPSTRLGDVPWENLSDRAVSGFGWQIYGDGGQVVIGGSINSVSLTVLEPGAAVLVAAVGLALSGVALSRRAPLT